MRLPHFSRSQLGVILLLGVSLFLLWAWRANFFLAPSPPRAAIVPHVFVEVRGAVAHPGVYGFPQPPTLAEVFHKAGAAGPVPAPSAQDQKLSSGNLVEIGANGQHKIGRMSGPQLLTLGLALDLNTATAADLDALPGIGPALAQRIIDYQQAHGPFKKIDDLIEVSGIGPNKMAQIKPYLVINEPETRD